ncbi:hypothetical protein ONA91_31080 [Micromonospora sp. DR5-3]|uniref:hypothetical protein n=1 Tax=unclassified Micromonospora TaxID=2617518 RepID=UPI0011D452C2|nr:MULTISPECIES: hypothetical protein [unclassified Micromonospora]MCW3818892.1 hypothetical protein [Micromonospora sp. DR5-3]TYC18191.1 hypothetical protein FXF52_39025 [Micromonospora sp. MP36]
MQIHRRSVSARTSTLVIAVVGSVIAGLTPPVAAQPLPESVVGKTATLVPNGGFDAGDRAGHPIGWSVEGNEAGANIVNLGAWRTAGLGSLEINDAEGTAVSVRSDRIVVVPGGAYTLTAKVKGKSGTPAWLYLEFWSFEGTRVGVTNVTPAFSGDWQTVNVTATAPANAAHVTALVYGSQAASGASYWDEVNLQLAPQSYDKALGAKRELFLDDYRIESAHDVGRVLHPAQTTQQPVVRADKPWEASAYTYGSVFKVGDVYRMWYTCYNDQPPNYFLCYAESMDGANWDKPLGRGSIGYKDVPASQTNIVAEGGGTIAYNPDAPADRRYALMRFKSGVVNQTLGYYVWFSPDGYTWTPGPDKPVLLDGDVSNVNYDPATRRYIATIKKRMFTSRTPGTYDRSAFVSTSTDFITWTTPVIGVSGDYADDGAAEAIGGLEGQIYGMPVAPYESTYIGFPWVFSILNYTAGQFATAADGPVTVQIASSRDLTRWTRPTRDPIIEPGRPGAWNDGAHYTASNILVGEKTVQMYYAAFNNGHGGAEPNNPDRDNHVGQTGLATWRRDGFVSLSNASLPNAGDPGEVTTKPVVFDGTSLHLNAVVHGKGTVAVEVLDADGQPIAGYTAADAVPIRGDNLDVEMKWTGRKLADLAGREVKFRFHLVNTDLYSFWIGS